MSPKPPTTSQLLSEIHSMQAAILQNAQDISDLKQWRIVYEASKKAVDDYRRSEKNGQYPTETRLNKDLVKYIGTALGIIAALVYLLQGAHP
jgi:hypothetical protein